MASAAVVFESRTGVTRQFAEEIGDHLAAAGLQVRVEPVDECDPASLAGVDLILLGCWTSGIFVALQHPDDAWIAFARRLPAMPDARVALFTTYKLVTGRMFRQMRRHLPANVAPPSLELKSRNGHLAADHREVLDRWIADALPAARTTEGSR